MAALIATDLAAITDQTVSKVLFNLGANDINGITQADWENYGGQIVDAMQAKWPAVKVYFMRPWMRDQAAAVAKVEAAITNVIAARPTWCFIGPDERVFLENGDNGVTYTTDGVHPNAAGYALTAAQWKTVLGY